MECPEGSSIDMKPTSRCKEITMAMEGDRETDQGTQLGKPSWRKRIDPRHSPSNVPVLFRLKNLQRAAVDDWMGTGQFADSGNMPASKPSQTVEAPRGQSSVPTPHLKQANPPSTKVAGVSASPASPAGQSKPDPVATPGKHGVSNGFIFLIAAVGVAFVVGRNWTPSKQPIAKASRNSSDVLDSTSPSQPAIASVTSIATPSIESKSVEPLIVPELPELAGHLTEDKQSIADEISDEGSMAEIDNDDESAVVLLDPDQASNPDSQDNDADLKLPSTLTTIENPNVRATTNSAVSKPATWASNPDSNKLTQSDASKSATESSSSPVATTTPERDIESMMRIRNAYIAQNSPSSQSQFDAIARAKQGIATTSTPDFSAPTSGYVASAPSAYAFTQPSYPNNLHAQPVGYGTPPVGMNYSSSMPSTTMPVGTTPTASQQPYQPIGSSMIPPEYPQAGQATMPVYTPSNYAPAAASQPANSPYAQPTNQPYLPVYSQPTAPVAPAPTGAFLLPTSAPSPYVPIGQNFDPNAFSQP
jgi:hypothetical protein